jgi:hypothetical protein
LFRRITIAVLATATLAVAATPAVEAASKAGDAPNAAPQPAQQVAGMFRSSWS